MTPHEIAQEYIGLIVKADGDWDAVRNELAEKIEQYAASKYKHTTVVNRHTNAIFKGPFRVGKKMGSAVLDKNGHQVVVFPKGLENCATDYVTFLNSENTDKTTTDVNNVLLDGLSTIKGCWIVGNQTGCSQTETIARQRKEAIDRFLNGSTMTWKECQTYGWRVYKVNVVFQLCQQ